MKDFEIRCDESRLEKNNTLYGKFSLGPFLPGQGTTFGNALRRSLLSELSGLGITAFEIIGVMQEFSTLPGLRESVLDLSLNLKQIVLTGVLPFSTPPIGFLKVRGPAIIYAADLKLPAGVYCAAPKQYIGTLASNGVLNLKFLVSVGKGHSTQPYSLYRSLSKVKLQPWKRESMFFSNSINKGSELHKPEIKNDATLFDDEWKNSNWKNNSLLSQSTLASQEAEMDIKDVQPSSEMSEVHEYSAPPTLGYSVAEKDRTRNIAGPTGGRTVQTTSSDMQFSQNSRIAPVNQDVLTKSIDSRELESTNKKTANPVTSSMHPTAIRELELKRQKVFNAEILNNTTTLASQEAEMDIKDVQPSGEAESANSEKKGAILASHDNSRIMRSKDVSLLARTCTEGSETSEEVQVHAHRTKNELVQRRSQGELNTKIALNNESELGLETKASIKYVNMQKQTFQRVNPHQVLPIDAVFTPVSQVNFLTQVNDRFETPRENVVLEIWTNGSIHPKRALEEAALSLVQNFDTLLKNIQQASSFHKGLRYSNSFHDFNEKTVCNQIFSCTVGASASSPISDVPQVHANSETSEKVNASPMSATLKQGSETSEKNNLHQILDLKNTENFRKKTPSIIGKFNQANVPLHQAIYNLDIGNLDLSLETFILLKQAKIKNLAHLLKNLYSKEGKFFIKVEQSFLQNKKIYTNGVECTESASAIDQMKSWSEKKSAINNMDLDKSCLEQNKGENIISIEEVTNVCLNEKIIEELSNIFSQLGIN